MNEFRKLIEGLRNLGIKKILPSIPEFLNWQLLNSEGKYEGKSKLDKRICRR